MRDDARQRRLRQLLKEMMDDEGAGAIDLDEARLYAVVFDALEEEPGYPPLTGLAEAVDARLADEGHGAGDRVGAAGSMYPAAGPARPNIFELVVAAALALVGSLAVPAVTVPLTALADVAARHGAAANLDLLLVSALSALLLGSCGRNGQPA